MAINPGQQLADANKGLMKRTVKDQSGAGKLKIGELLSKAGYITATQFEEAKTTQKKTGERLGRILLESGAIERDTIANFLSRMHQYTLVVIDQEAPSREALHLVPYETAKRFLAFPLRLAGNTLQITMAEPEKVGGFSGVFVAEDSGGLAVAPGDSHLVADAVSALVNLGYPQYTAWQALRVVQQQFPEATGLPKVEELIRLALQSLAGK
jgi:hypothetical protein